jgi:branched-subunit amino acid ABC-type transport system permease component
MTFIYGINSFPNFGKASLITLGGFAVCVGLGVFLSAAGAPVLLIVGLGVLAGYGISKLSPVMKRNWIGY